VTGSVWERVQCGDAGSKGSHARPRSSASLCCSPPIDNHRVNIYIDIMEIITRKKAKEQGLKRYFTGKPCKHGHVNERRVSTGHCLGCVEANKEETVAYQKARYEANKEEIAAYQKARYEANKEEIAAYAKAYRKANKKKVATDKKAWYEANKKKVAAGKKAWYEANREEIAARRKSWYEANKEEITARVKEYRNANPEKCSAQHKAYRKSNSESLAASGKAYRNANPEKIAAHSSKRRASERNAIPKWFTNADDTIIEFMFIERNDISKQTGIEQHLDHGVPLTGKISVSSESAKFYVNRLDEDGNVITRVMSKNTVCGLHIGYNLEIVEGAENLSKSNTWNPMTEIIMHKNDDGTYWQEVML